MAEIKRITKVCPQCGNNFSTNARPSKQATYCSFVCRRLYLVGTPEEQFWNKVDKRGPDECWPWLGQLTEKWYGVFTVNGKQVRAHRFSLELVNGKLPEGMFALHTCDYAPCCNPAHLYAGTALQNIHDKMDRGSQVAKLTPEKVRQIRALRGIKTQIEIAEEFDISIPLVCRVQTGQIWKHVEDIDGTLVALPPRKSEVKRHYTKHDYTVKIIL